MGQGLDMLRGQPCFGRHGLHVVTFAEQRTRKLDGVVLVYLLGRDFRLPGCPVCGRRVQQILHA
jgi:hypothetical protein